MKEGYPGTDTFSGFGQNKPGGQKPIGVSGCRQALYKRRALPSLIVALLVLGLIFPGAPVWAADPDQSRFFFSGDGRIALFSQKNGYSFTGLYRHGARDYDKTALQTICRVFDHQTTRSCQICP